jgi:glycine betaine transporter
VSKGRTIKEFVLGVLLIPTLFGTIWFSAFGGSALFFELFENRGIVDAVSNDVTTALFITLEQFPLGTILAGLATLLIITFFITSADSATLVLGMLTSKGVLNPANSTKIIWGVLQSSIAAVLLWSGGLNGLQTASIVAALPFAVIMVFMVVSLSKSLNEEVREQKRIEKKRNKKLDELLKESEL